MITLKPRKQTKCDHLLLCRLIVKLTRTVYKNNSYGNLVFTEPLFEVGESFWNKLSNNGTCLVPNKHLVPNICSILFPKQWVNSAK